MTSSSSDWLQLWLSNPKWHAQVSSKELLFQWFEYWARTESVHLWRLKSTDFRESIRNGLRRTNNSSRQSHPIAVAAPVPRTADRQTKIPNTAVQCTVEYPVLCNIAKRYVIQRREAAAKYIWSHWRNARTAPSKVTREFVRGTKTSQRDRPVDVKQ